MIPFQRPIDQTSINTIAEQWNMACLDGVSQETIQHPAIAVPCGHIYEQFSATQMQSHGTKCCFCRGTVTGYVATHAVAKLMQEGNTFLKVIQELFNKNQALKEGRTPPAVTTTHGDLSPITINHPVLTSCGHEMFDQGASPLRLGSRCSITACQLPITRVITCIAKDIIDRRNEFAQLIVHLEQENASLERAGPRQAMLVQIVTPASAQPVQTPYTFSEIPYPGENCRLLVNRPWTPLEPTSMSLGEQAEALKYPELERRWAAKNVDGDDRILAYVRVNGRRDGRIEIMLGSMLRQQFKDYLNLFGWDYDRDEDERKDGRNSEMGIFIARTPEQLAWALDFIKRNPIDPEQYGFLEKLVANSNDWRAVERANQTFVQEGFRKYAKDKAGEAANQRYIESLNPAEFATKRQRASRQPQQAPGATHPKVAQAAVVIRAQRAAYERAQAEAAQATATARAPAAANVQASTAVHAGAIAPIHVTNQAPRVAQALTTGRVWSTGAQFTMVALIGVVIAAAAFTFNQMRRV